jgi:diguanylate cyclase (GGDEF)-like protein
LQACIEGGGTYLTEYRRQTKLGDWLWIRSVGKIVQWDANHRAVRMIGLNTDITERKQMEDQVHQLAFFDPLTKLPNRRLLTDRLSQAMAASKRSGCYCALMFADLDNFKPLNDTHGHEVGDLLLIEVAERLKSCIREMDTVARFGGDEFIVMICELDTDKTESAKQAGVVAEKIRAALASPYILKVEQEGKIEATVEHHCSASIGIALFFDHETSQIELLKEADRAMYQAKDAGCNSIRFYSPEN